MMISINLNKYRQLLDKSYEKEIGKVIKMVGLTIEASGPAASLNDICYITGDGPNDKKTAEVIGFRENRILLMPYDDMTGVGIGSLVESSGTAFKVPVGDLLLGKTLDGLGNPMDGTKIVCGGYYPAEAAAPDPLKRKIIDEVLPLGVKAVDALLTVGKGQRIGIFAGSGVGKSTLLGMFARNTKADINVIALIGERGREVREFIERDLGAEGIKRSVLVVATSDKPALIRKKAAKTATAIAE
jgi:flagellum-specific ATP synthase